MYDLKNAEICRGHLLRTWVCNRLALTALPTNFKGQKALKHAYPYFVDDLVL